MKHTIYALGAGALALALAALPIGCGKSETNPAGENAQAAPQRTPDGVYTVRGRVTMLPDPANRLSGFRVFHEALPNFVGREGNVVGMPSHDMEFPRLAPGVTLDGIEVGDLVELTFAVYWSENRYDVTELRELPADTPLNLGSP